MCLTAVLLHYGKTFPSVYEVHADSKKEIYENFKLMYEQLQ